MFSKPQKKYLIKLEDFDFRREIKVRIFLAELTPFELTVLQEVLHQPLIFSIEVFSDHIRTKHEDVKRVLRKLSENTLLRMEGDTVAQNKEMRKLFEFHVSKFDSNFKPSVSFIIQQLNQVPLSTLLDWYPIPQSSDDIIDSIIERCLKSPKVFHHYKMEFLSEAPEIYKKILERLYSAKELKISAQEILCEYHLSREEFEKIVLYLEFHFLCFSTYEKKCGSWEQFLSPCDELKKYFLDYYLFPFTCVNIGIEKQEKKFPLLEKLSQELARISHVISSEDSRDVGSGLCTIAQEHYPMAIGTDLTDCSDSPREKIHHGDISSETIISWMQASGFLEKKKHQLKVTDLGVLWLKMPLEEQARYFHRKLLLCEELSLLTSRFSVKDFRNLGKSFKRIAHLGWVNLREFIQKLDISIGNEGEVSLKKKGNAWEYVLPKYSDVTISWIHKVISEYYVNIGMLKIAEWDNDTYISLTDFGRKILDCELGFSEI